MLESINNIKVDSWISREAKVDQKQSCNGKAGKNKQRRKKRSNIWTRDTKEQLANKLYTPVATRLKRWIRRI